VPVKKKKKRENLEISMYRGRSEESIELRQVWMSGLIEGPKKQFWVIAVGLQDLLCIKLCPIRHVSSIAEHFVFLFGSYLQCEKMSENLTF
jgi:hypothetical protein